jgi:small conductance mechanosensitive channel
MDFLDQVDINLSVILLRLGSIVVVFIVGRWLAGVSRRWLTRSMQRYELTESIITLVTTLVYYSILILTFAIVLALLGVPPNIIAGALGVIIIVLAITLQASLANLAATVNFLLFKHFELGDFIQTAGIMGIVQEIQLFSTVLVSPDHKTHVLPNSKIQGAGITNFSKIGDIRVDQAYRISYSSDVDKAQEIVAELLAKDERVLTQPTPEVFVGRLAEDHIEIGAWPFVAITDFLSFQNDIVKEVMEAFDKAGITIPLPQQEVHLVGQS